MRKRYIVLADRGLGILETLKQVRPTLKTHIEAVNVAFTEILSGRAPEKRGNGLKFVREVTFTNPLIYFSRVAMLKFVLKRPIKNFV